MNISFHRDHRRSWKRYLWWGIGIFVLLSFALFLLNLSTLKKVAASSRDGAQAFASAKEAIEKQDFSTAAEFTHAAVAHFEEGERHVQKLRELRIVPFASRQIDAVETLLAIGIRTGQSVGGLADLAHAISEPVFANGNTHLGSLTREQKGELLGKLDASEEELLAAEQAIEDAAILLDELPKHFLAPPIASAATTLREQLPSVKRSIDSAVPLLRVLPELLGHPEPKRYLFLLQNNNEMRPTGGFIGTYGILKLDNGDIDSFSTDNIYNLDKNAPDGSLEPAPAALSRYLSVNKWYLRDSNWSPDFRESSKHILQVYDAETQAKNDFQGVVAITPTLLESFLELLGPVTVQGTTFTKENAIATLQYLVEVGYTEQGIAEENRKDVIGVLSDTLLTRLFALPRERWGTLTELVREAASRKDILLYLTNEDAQHILEREDWTGSITQGDDHDLLFIVDANLASLKTDDVMKRNVSYSLRPFQESGERKLRASLSVTYEHHGSFDWKTTRYRSYTRVYIPSGASLVSAKGFYDNDRLHGGKEVLPDVGEELGKTVIGGFLYIEPGETHTVEIVYDLPDDLRRRFDKGEYDLNFEKQAGVRNASFSLDIEGTSRIQSYSPEASGSSDGKHFRAEGSFEKDLEFSLRF